MDDTTTRYEAAFAEGGLPALVALAVSEQAEMADLANRHSRGLSAEQEAHEATRARERDLTNRLEQIAALAKTEEDS